MKRKAAFIYSDALSRYTLRTGHAMVPSRLRHTYDLLEAYGAFRGADSRILEPRLATLEEISSFHTPSYIEAVEGLSIGRDKVRSAEFNFSDFGDNPIYPGMYEAAALSTGGSVVAADLVSRGEVEVAFNIAGGLHHAMPSYASGFCVFNDPVIAIKHLLRRGLRVAYVDIDAHHGDGVQHAFYDSDTVLTISLHESGEFLFPGTGMVAEFGRGKGKGYSVNAPLHPFTDDDVYMLTFREVVAPLVKAYKPDVLVTQLGVDTHRLDPLAHLRLSSGGYVQIIRELECLGLPWLALGGGGYDVGVVARCWTLAYGVMLGQDWPEQIPVACRDEYGIESLRDEAEPMLDDSTRSQALEYARRTISQIKRLIFPAHGL